MAHFNGIKLTVPDRIDAVLAPLVIAIMAAVILGMTGQSAASWSLIGSISGGVVSRILGVQVLRSVNDTVAAGVFSAVGGVAGLTVYALLG